jgi:tetratricopeptide (TPR) repeat protein
MSNNNAEQIVFEESEQRHERGGRRRRWALGLVAFAAVLLFLELVVLGALQGWIEAPAVDEVDWLKDSALAKAIATSTPTPSPTPTLTPAERAAQFVPQLQAALDSANWGRALEITAIMNGVDPQGKQVHHWTYTTHMQYGQALVEAGHEDQAQTQFDDAVALEPKDPEALLWQDTTQQYLAGARAFQAGDWDTAIESFRHAYGQIPDYGDVFPRLVTSYRRKGEAAIEQEGWSVAIKALEQAIKWTPEDDPEGVELTALLSTAYLGKGQAAMVQEDWTSAIETMLDAQEQLPNDQAIVDLLARAYRERGIAQHEAVKLKPAKADLEMALSLRPNDEKAQSHLGQVEYLLSKRIEIDISKQRLYAWKEKELVFNFPVSTGLRGQDTSTGRFQVLDKIPMAYSRVWRLKMPYWMGIYWVKGIENGIHALPIRPDGSVMWAGLLGQRASYGCIILSRTAAKKLYNWADIGTQVHIHQ